MGQLARVRVNDPLPPASGWPAAVVQCIEDIRPAILALGADASRPRIRRHAENPAHQAIQPGSPVTLDWEIVSGAQRQWRASRRSSPVDPAAVEWWSGTAWGSEQVWIDGRASVATLTGWNADEVYAVSVEVADADGIGSNAETWAVLVGQGKSAAEGGNRTVVSATPAKTTLDADTSTATIRVDHISGPTPTQVRIQRTTGALDPEYWTGTAWAAGETWAAFAGDDNGGADYSLTDFPAGPSTLAVTARAAADTPADQWSVIHSLAVTRAGADGTHPVITRSGTAAPAAGTVNLRMSFSDAQDGSAPTAARVQRGTVSGQAFSPSHYWTGTAWAPITAQADQWLATTATTFAVPLAAGQSARVVLRDSDGHESNALVWTAVAAQHSPVLSRSGSATLVAGDSTLQWTFSDADNDAQTQISLLESKTGGQGRHWDGSKWVNSDALVLWVAHTAQSVAVPTRAGWTYTLLIRTGTGAAQRPSNSISWTAQAPAPQRTAPVMARVGGATLAPGTATLQWTVSDAENDAQGTISLLETKVGETARYWNGTAWASPVPLAAFIAHTAQTLAVPCRAGWTYTLTVTTGTGLARRVSNSLVWQCAAPQAGPPTIAYRDPSNGDVPKDGQAGWDPEMTWHYSSPTDIPQGSIELVTFAQANQASKFYWAPAVGPQGSWQPLARNARGFFARSALAWGGGSRTGDGWVVALTARDTDGRESNQLIYRESSL